MSQKIIVAFMLGVIVTSITFGIYNSRARKRDAVDEVRISDLETELATARQRNSEITSGLRWLATANSQHTDGLEIIADSNRQVTDGLGDLGSGISEDSERLQRLIDAIDSRIKSSKEEIKTE